MTLGEKIKELREVQGLTQQELADKLFVSRQTVCRWENGTRCPDLIMAKKIAIALNISVDDLFTDEELSNYVPPKESGLDISCVKVMMTGLMLVVIDSFLISADINNNGYAALCFFSGIAIFVVGLFIPTALKASSTKDEELQQRKCPKCGKKHDFDYPKCPFCNYDFRQENQK